MAKAALARLVVVATGAALAATAAWMGAPAGLAQAKNGGTTSQAPAHVDWPMHNLDLRNGRYSPLDEINASTVQNLKLKWSVDVDERTLIRQVTPIVLNG